jgi:hypothetical protein
LVEIGLLVVEIFFFTLLLLSSLWEGYSNLFTQSWILIPQEWFMPSLVIIGLVVLEKCLRTDRRRVIRKTQWIFSSGELK